MGGLPCACHALLALPLLLLLLLALPCPGLLSHSIHIQVLKEVLFIVYADCVVIVGGDGPALALHGTLPRSPRGPHAGTTTRAYLGVHGPTPRAWLVLLLVLLWHGPLPACIAALARPCGRRAPRPWAWTTRTSHTSLLLLLLGVLRSAVGLSGALALSAVWDLAHARGGPWHGLGGALRGRWHSDPAGK